MNDEKPQEIGLDVGQQTDRGRRRQRNEDSLNAAIHPKAGHLFVVSDGAGGENYGDKASLIAVGRAVELYYQLYQQAKTQNPSQDVDIESIIRTVIEQINTEVYTYAESLGVAGRMGATIVLAILQGHTLYVGWAGDSRAYVVSSERKQARQITQDHNQREEDIRFGRISREEAAQMPERNILTRSLGGQPYVEPEIRRGKLENGETLVLCSDGLSQYATERDIYSIVAGGETAQKAADRFIDFANNAGGSDNITALVVGVGRRVRSIEPDAVTSPGSHGEKKVESGGYLQVDGAEEEVSPSALPATAADPMSSVEPSPPPVVPARPSSSGANIDYRLLSMALFALMIVVAVLAVSWRSIPPEPIATLVENPTQETASDVPALASTIGSASATVTEASTPTPLQTATSIPSATFTVTLDPTSTQFLTETPTVTSPPSITPLPTDPPATATLPRQAPQVNPGDTFYVTKNGACLKGIASMEESACKIRLKIYERVVVAVQGNSSQYTATGHYHVDPDGVEGPGWVEVVDLTRIKPEEWKEGEALATAGFAATLRSETDGTSDLVCEPPRIGNEFVVLSGLAQFDGTEWWWNVRVTCDGEEKNGWVKQNQLKKP